VCFCLPSDMLPANSQENSNFQANLNSCMRTRYEVVCVDSLQHIWNLLLGVVWCGVCVHVCVSLCVRFTCVCLCECVHLCVCACACVCVCCGVHV